MRVLAIDIGSSSVKAAVLTGPRPGIVARRAFKTTYAGPRVEVSAAAIAGAVRKAVADLGDAVRSVDLIVPTGMAPSWLATDASGRPLTPVVTHQDRRSQAEAEAIEKEVGRARHLAIAGNRPTPGGISSTTLRWFVRHAKSLMKRTATVGHLNTWLVHSLTGARAIDPGNAAFTGLYRTATLGGWDDELLAAAGAKAAWLPRVIDADAVAGRVTAAGARRWGVTVGTPVVAGFIDGSGGLLATGPRAGRVLNVVGSTDVLAVAADPARPFEGLLTRPLGVGRRWLSVGTVAAAGTAIDWAHRTLFADHSPHAFFAQVNRAARRPTHGVSFDARLAGSRTSVEPATAAIAGLTLGIDRRDVLAALLDDLARRSAHRFDSLRRAGVRFDHRAITTGGGDRTLARVLRRDWPGRWTFESLPEATLAGAWAVAQQPRDA